jgi:hypothetical protein
MQRGRARVFRCGAVVVPTIGLGLRMFASVHQCQCGDTGYIEDLIDLAYTHDLASGKDNYINRESSLRL